MSNYRRRAGIRIEVWRDADALALGTAQEIAGHVKEAIELRGMATLSVSGGSTPRKVYEKMAGELRDRFEWGRLFLFFGDERTVPPDHPDSNFRMVERALLEKVPLPRANVYRMAGEASPIDGAGGYEDALRAFFHHGADGEFPRFDVMMLGLGEDGHTASLFPETDALKNRKDWVVANHVPQLHTTRLSLTYPVINHSRHIMVLVSGEAKADIVARVLESPVRDDAYPMRGVSPVNGDLAWKLDKGSASLLKEPGIEK